MTMSNQITPGMTLDIGGKIYRVEASVKVKVGKRPPFIKTKLRDLITEKVIEKNFRLNQPVNEVSLIEHTLEYLFPEGKKYLFLDISDLKQVLVPSEILGNKINYLKEGVQIKAMFYGNSIFSVDLPHFLELMVVKTEKIDEKLSVSNATKKAVLETGAVVEVPLFIEVGDVLKIDVHANEYIQRV